RGIFRLRPGHRVRLSAGARQAPCLLEKGTREYELTAEPPNLMTRCQSPGAVQDSHHEARQCRSFDEPCAGVAIVLCRKTDRRPNELRFQRLGLAQTPRS